MAVVRGQDLGQRGSGRLCLFGLLGVDDDRQHIGELRKLGLERQRPLAPGQALGEHFVGVGADAEMTGGKEAGKDREGERGRED